MTIQESLMQLKFQIFNLIGELDHSLIRFNWQCWHSVLMRT